MRYLHRDFLSVYLLGMTMRVCIETCEILPSRVSYLTIYLSKVYLSIYLLGLAKREETL